MKIAYRFPIKSSPLLLSIIILLHFSLLILALLLSMINAWPIHYLFLFSLVILISSTYSYRHYVNLTQAVDDLCWTGENWVIFSDSKIKTRVYLNLKSESWVSSKVSLLHFKSTNHIKSNNKDYQWLFTQKGLGKKTYSDLTYLVRQGLR